MNHGVDPAGSRRTERKLRVARRIILGSMLFILLILVGMPLTELRLGTDEVTLWRTLLAEAVAVPSAWS
ncbi:hypothetical protein HFP72_14735 [Nocardiopsis sp. ARC36]